VLALLNPPSARRFTGEAAIAGRDRQRDEHSVLAIPCAGKRKEGLYKWIPDDRLVAMFEVCVALVA
jgi:hypothetical protein